MTQPTPASAAGRYTFPGTGLTVNRIGFGAMQLAGPGVFGEPADPAECAAVLKEAIALGVDHIDTSDFYGPHVVNRILRETLHPYPDDLVFVSKVGAKRDDKGAWIHDLSADFLRQSVLDNLERLSIDQVPIVNLRMGHAGEDIVAPMKVMRRLKDDGLIGHIGVSTVSMEQLRAAQAIAPVVCVQNHYNLVHREDDAMIDALAEEGIPYVPYFPLGGFAPIHSEGLSDVARDLGRSVQTVALAWLLQRSPNMLLIPGTSKRAHLRDNIAAGTVEFDAASLKKLNGLAALV
ncbi:MAG: oxidoreductase [Hyphomonas sp.]|nr:oxidoreductase [Hyphomonas sp.]